MAPARDRRTGFSRRRQYGVFMGYVFAVAGAVVGLVLLVASTFNPPAFSALRMSVAGVTTPMLIVNQYTTVDFLKGGVAFFRQFDEPYSTGYGWMRPGELVDNNIPLCKPTPYPQNNRLASSNGINGGCTPYHGRRPWPTT